MKDILYKGKPINKYSRPELIEIATELIQAKQHKTVSHDEAQDWIAKNIIR